MSTDNSKEMDTSARRIFRSFSGAALIIVGFCMIILSKVLETWSPSIGLYLLFSAIVPVVFGLALLLYARKGWMHSSPKQALSQGL